jgi:putative addiction module component (TIGR02574 family)
MTNTAEILCAQVVQLPPGERIKVVERILDSLDKPDASLDALWANEADSRLGDCPPGELRAMPQVMKRVQAVKAARLNSKSLPTKKLAATPTRFHVENMPTTPYLVMPEVSSERRPFIPFGFEQPSTLCSNLVKLAPNATLFHFGVLSSTMHNAWMRTTCGRLKSDYRYSKDIVYNNFPWPEFVPTVKTTESSTLVHPYQTAIETAAQTVLDVRARFQTGEQPATLADLYDPLTMPPELLKAHQKLDAAVDKAYEANGGKKHYKSDAERVAFLFELYQKYTCLLPSDKPKSKRKARLV